MLASRTPLLEAFQAPNATTYTHEYPLFISDYRLTRSFWLSSISLLLYDYALTFSDEVAYIWRGRWTLMRILFCVARYLTITMLISLNVFLAITEPSTAICTFTYWWFSYACAVIHGCVGSILILRVNAMYLCNKKLLTFLSTFFACSLTAETMFITYMLTQMQTVPMSMRIGCVPENRAKSPWAYFIPMTMFETLLFLLMLAKALSDFMKSDMRTSSLMNVLVRDSVVAFGGTLAWILTNLVIWAIGRPTLFATFPEMVITVHAIVGCRMVLNIHSTAKPWLGRPWRREESAQLSDAWERAPGRSWLWDGPDSLLEVGEADVGPDESDASSIAAERDPPLSVSHETSKDESS